MTSIVPAQDRTRGTGGGAGTLAVMRQMLLAVLVIGLLGLGTELLLLAHYESPAQILAPGFVGLALLIVAWHAVDRGRWSLLCLQIVMGLFLGAGLLGMFLHYGANVEFQREIDPGIAGMALFWKVVAAKVPPALAPGAMAQLGLIGLVYAYRHPGLRANGVNNPQSGYSTEEK